MASFIALSHVYRWRDLPALLHSTSRKNCLPINGILRVQFESHHFARWCDCFEQFGRSNWHRRRCFHCEPNVADADERDAESRACRALCANVFRDYRYLFMRFDRGIDAGIHRLKGDVHTAVERCIHMIDTHLEHSLIFLLKHNNRCTATQFSGNNENYRFRQKRASFCAFTFNIVRKIQLLSVARNAECRLVLK